MKGGSLTFHENIARNFQSKGNGFLTLALLAAAAVIIVIALQPNPWLKAGALAWVVLP